MKSPNPEKFQPALKQLAWSDLEINQQNQLRLLARKAIEAWICENPKQAKDLEKFECYMIQLSEEKIVMETLNVTPAVAYWLITKAIRLEIFENFSKNQRA